MTLWSRLAQVREPVATLHYGDRVIVLERKKEDVRVRTPRGETGWLEEHQLMEPGLWSRATKLVGKSSSLPVQARAHTKVPSNVRLEPGRAAPRIYQFGRGVPVEVLVRASVQSSPSAEEAPAKETALPAAEPEPLRREDWLFVRGKEEGEDVAGWVLGRFLELDLPDPLRDYAAGIRFVAWFELNRVADEEGEKPQFLAAGVARGEDEPCDFNLLRVYTWNKQRKRYETAYVESRLCGRFPIRVAREAGQPVFRFTAIGKGGEQERVYQMRQNIVRRVGGRGPANRR